MGISSPSTSERGAAAAPPARVDAGWRATTLVVLFLAMTMIAGACGGDSAPEAEISGVAGSGGSARTDGDGPSSTGGPGGSDGTNPATTGGADETVATSGGSDPLGLADIAPQQVRLPSIPAIVLPDLSELDDIGSSIEDDLGDVLGPDIDVVSAGCEADGGELIYRKDGDSFLSVGRNGSGTFETEVDGRKVEISVGSNGSGTYSSEGEVSIEVSVSSNGSGRYERTSGDDSLEVSISANGSGRYEESTGSVTTSISLAGVGSGTYERIDSGPAGGELKVSTSGEGSGRYSASSADGGEETFSSSGEGFTWSRNGGDPPSQVRLNVSQNGSGSYVDDEAGIEITVGGNGSGSYKSPDTSFTFSGATGILDPALIDIGPIPEFVAADRFPKLDTLPPLQPACATIVRIDSSVLFDFDKADLRPEAGPVLDELAMALEEAGRGVEIGGHTDSIGEDAYNLDLSQRRADAVDAALKERGLTVDTTARGFGESKPVAANETPSGDDDPVGRQANRRVEIVVRAG